MPILIDVLFRNWQAKKSECIFTVNAVIALVRSPKSRITDNAFNMLKNEWKLGVIKPLPLETLDETKLEPVMEPVYDKPDVPDFAIDKHTRAGKSVGRCKANFYEQGARLNNKAPSAIPTRRVPLRGTWKWNGANGWKDE